jgi:hypothetical protein
VAVRRTACSCMLAFDGGALALIAIRCTGITPNAHALSCSSSDLASFKSSVSKPSVNQP